VSMQTFCNFLGKPYTYEQYKIMNYLFNKLPKGWAGTWVDIEDIMKDCDVEWLQIISLVGDKFLEFNTDNTAIRMTINDHFSHNSRTASTTSYSCSDFDITSSTTGRW